MRVDIPKSDLVAFCVKHRIVRLSLFGSVLREDFNPDSDIDVMVEFDPDTSPTFFDLVHAEDDLRKLMRTDRKVDVLTPGAVHPAIRDNVFRSRKVVYEAG